MSNEKIIIIQNTHYHFETTISLYQILKDMGYDVYVYKCRNVQDVYEQDNFKKKYNVNTIEDIQQVNNVLCGIIVSVYPNPHVTELDRIPNADDIIFSILGFNKMIFITHRFKYSLDYEKDINAKNTLSLSPISNKLGIDHIVLNKNPIIPINTYDDNVIKLTLQGHLEFNHRDVDILIENILNINSSNKSIILNVIGTSTQNIVDQLQCAINNTQCNIKINKIENANEELFYYYLNEQTDWLLALLTPEIKNQTYSVERYSSTFNHATALDKPIICHEFFENIYKIPGLYFDENNKNTILNRILSYNTEIYNHHIDRFKYIRKKTSIYNLKIIKDKIKNLYVI